jgi:hypothetical protein
LTTSTFRILMKYVWIHEHEKVFESSNLEGRVRIYSTIYHDDSIVNVSQVI